MHEEGWTLRGGRHCRISPLKGWMMRFICTPALQDRTGILKLMMPPPPL